MQKEGYFVGFYGLRRRRRCRHADIAITAISSPDTSIVTGYTSANGEAQATRSHNEMIMVRQQVSLPRRNITGAWLSMI